MVRETRLSPADMIAPLFVRHGSGLREPIPSMPGQYHLPSAPSGTLSASPR